jgi:hypothetical protein
MAAVASAIHSPAGFLWHILADSVEQLIGWKRDPHF